MKGIILAGGAGTRLAPMTTSVSKQMLPVYDKPMVYYPLSILMLAGLRDILLISTPRDLSLFKILLGDGSAFGINITYAEQPDPGGLAQAFLIGEQHLDGGPACLILGDNLFYGHGMPDLLKASAARTNGAQVYAYHVPDPQRYGVVSFDQDDRVTRVVEKPENPESNWAISGLYFYDNQVVDVAKSLAPSPRGELEITDVNKFYLDQGALDVCKMGRGYTWFDTGTPDSLLDASNFVQAMDRRQSFKIACLEEIALQNHWVDADDVLARAQEMGKGDYATYLRRRVKEICDA